MAGKVHFITWSQHEDGDKGDKFERDEDGSVRRVPARRFRARYTQALAHVIAQAEHDRDVNGRQDVRIEDAAGKTVWPRSR